MKKIALVFVLAILLPALLLAVLAVRSLRDQELVANSQRVQLHQAACDRLAANLNFFMEDVRSFNEDVVNSILEDTSPDVIPSYNRRIQQEWTQAAGGAVVSDDGEILSPNRNEGPWANEFLDNHAAFLTNRRVVEVYQAPARLSSQIAVVPETERKGEDSNLRKKAGASNREETVAPAGASAESAEQFGPVPPTEPALASAPRKVQASADKLQSFRFPTQEKVAKPREKEAPVLDTTETESAADSGMGSAPPIASAEAMMTRPVTQQSLRNVAPARQWQAGNVVAVPGEKATQLELAAPQAYNQYSALSREAVLFNELAAEETEGAVSRIIDGELHVLLWKRHPAIPGYTFWTELDLATIKADVANLVTSQDFASSNPEVSLALLDASGSPIAQTVEGFVTDWALPFVASEVGQILPRWEVAAYLLNPKALDESARTLRITLSLITLILVSAVGVGSFLILRSVNYEMRLATRKTDFVSNVSHELKTPLTSIRMFSELLASDESPGGEQTRTYSTVISKESARLSRLINRLLDFSRLDRGEMKLRDEIVALPDFLKSTVETYRYQIEAEGLTLELSLPETTPIQVKGDSDALSQVFANLLSNAEKYGGTGRTIEVQLREPESEFVAIDVMDRGIGIPKAQQRRIFEKFYRIDDSIDSGIEGSGIGLALCRQIVELHGGSIHCTRREGGGSVFTVKLPLFQL